MKYGLTDTTVENICAVFARFPEIEKAVLYGSRAKGNFKTGSDIDLTLFGEALTSDLCSTIASALDDLLLPYTIDLSIFDELNHAKLREHIERVGVVFYKRANHGTGMKMGWERMTIGDVCDVVNGGTPKTGVSAYWDGPHQWITPAEMGKRSSPYIGRTERTITDEGLQNSSARLLPPHSVILSSRAPIGHLVINTEPMATNQGCKGLIPGGRIDSKFLFYYLTSIVALLNNLGTGATFKELSGGKMKEVAVPVPPLPEQQRIVAILDEAFAAIARAKENAAKNLQNARELFEAYMQSVFANPGDGWEEKAIEECFKVRSGDFLPAREMKKDGEIDVYGGNGITGRHDKYNLTGENIIIGRVGAKCGNVRLVEKKIWLTDNAFYISEFFTEFDLRYLEYLLNMKDLRNTANQAAQPVISYSTIKNIILVIPPLSQQRVIVAKLDALSAETKKLETIYRQKLDDLEELKKSVLKKAFEGEL
jgi:type I restriction enzyme S subunit